MDDQPESIRIMSRWRGDPLTVRHLPGRRALYAADSFAATDTVRIRVVALSAAQLRKERMARQLRPWSWDCGLWLLLRNAVATARKVAEAASLDQFLGSNKRAEKIMASRAGVEGFDIVRLLLAIFLPPVGVFLEVGLGLHFWLNILLTLLGFIPGIIHACYVIFTR